MRSWRRELLDDLGIDRVHVMGISWGGGLAQQFTRQYPRRVERLVLAATSTGHLMVPPRPSVLLKMATPMRYLSAGFFKTIAGSIYGGDFRKDDVLTRTARAPDGAAKHLRLSESAVGARRLDERALAASDQTADTGDGRR